MRWISHLYDFWSKSRCKSERAKTVKLQQQILSLSGLKNQSREFGASTATGEHVGNPGEDTARTGEGPLCITRPTSLLTAERHRHSPGYSGPAKTERAERGRELSTLQETRHLKLEFSRRHRLLNNENKHSLQTQEKIQGPCDTNKVWDRIQKSKIHEETGKQNNPKYACANRTSNSIQQKIDRIKRTDNSKRTVEDFKFPPLIHRTNRLKMSRAI